MAPENVNEQRHFIGKRAPRGDNIAKGIKSVPLGSDEVDPRGTVCRTRGVRIKET